MTVNERVNFLITELEHGNKSAFAEKIGSKSGVIGDIVGGRLNKPSFGVLEKIVSSYNSVNTDWLLTGEGEPFKKEKAESKPYPTDHPEAMVIENEPGHFGIQLFPRGTEKKHELQAIPLYDITASAGLSALYNSSNNILDYLSIPNLPRCDGAINVKGDSMYPLLKHGDIVVFQRLNDIADEIDFGEMYVVDMSTPNLERIYVKYVKKSDKGPEYVQLYSYNDKHHPPKDVKLSRIRAMAAVKASIRLS